MNSDNDEFTIQKYAFWVEDERLKLSFCVY
jgi:hypothetical protein